MSKEKASSRINNKIGGSGAPKKKSSPIMILFPLLIVAAVIGGVIFVLSGKEPEEAKNTVVTPENVEEVIANMEENQKVPMGSYEVVMTNKWHFPDGKSAAMDAYVENSVYNSNTVYFTITLDSTGEEIFKSPFIPVGSHISGITLDKELAAGTYTAVMTYHLVDSSNVETRRVSVGITLIIEK